MRVLLVEDEHSLAQGVVSGLEREGFVVDWVDSGRLAETAVKADPPDIMVLDLGLGDMDGLDLLASIRQKKHRFPILILTARGEVDDKVKGLDAGADDYMAKPFDFLELCARLRVLERRLGTASTSTISISNVVLHINTHQVEVGGKDLDLPRREYMLLKCLMENQGRVVTRDQLESRLYHWGDEISSNALEVHVHHLRKKLPDAFIKTIRGLGYTVPNQ
ncbi:response regulator transcription factor [Aequoribacter fuscus]|jgi:two-component system OmpR family response regulator|uniref:response regulator n=1 Tax=Aequoribacter fuscus TaxID=2518989 RepID=UPI0005928E9A|nr:response regulator transcription factor [Aequoribacter fuscus]QHJ87854.1 response regulator transcription factor [Aequoribacter fuscus]